MAGNEMRTGWEMRRENVAPVLAESQLKENLSAAITDARSMLCRVREAKQQAEAALKRARSAQADRKKAKPEVARAVLSALREAQAAREKSWRAWDDTKPSRSAGQYAAARLYPVKSCPTDKPIEYRECAIANAEMGGKAAEALRTVWDAEEETLKLSAEINALVGEAMFEASKFDHYIGPNGVPHPPKGTSIFGRPPRQIGK